MFKQAFANFNNSDLIVLGFMLFLFTFLGVMIWTLFVRHKDFYRELSLVPMRKDEREGE